MVKSPNKSLFFYAIQVWDALIIAPEALQCCRSKKSDESLRFPASFFNSTLDKLMICPTAKMSSAVRFEILDFIKDFFMKNQSLISPKMIQGNYDSSYLTEFTGAWVNLNCKSSL